jgi:hypothetical protein
VSKVELVQVVVEVGDELFQVCIPPECKDMVLRLIQSVSENGQLNVVKLPASMQKVTLAEALKEGQ